MTEESTELSAATIADSCFLPNFCSIQVVFAVVILLSLLAHVFFTLPVLLRFIGRVHPFRFMKLMSPAMLTAFSTASPSGRSS